MNPTQHGPTRRYGALPPVSRPILPSLLQPIQRQARRAAWAGALIGAGLAMAAWAPSARAGAAPLATALVLTDDLGHRLTLAAPAQRVVSLVPSLTEAVCALGACGRLVGTDRYSNWPAEVQRLPKVGGLEDTQIERIVSLKPDLVLVAVSSRARDRLQALGVPVLALEPMRLAETQAMLRTVAAALGVPAQGDRLWADTVSRIQQAAGRLPPAWRGQRVYFEVSAAPYGAGEASFVGELLAKLGLANIVPAAMGPFPKLNPEFVVRAQPAVLMASQVNLASMPGRPAWLSIRALAQRRTCAFTEAQGDVLVRPGPRLGEGADLIVDCLLRLGGPVP